MTQYWSHYDDIPASEDFDYGALRDVPEFFEANGEFSFSIITFEPGESGPLHYHEPPVEEIYLVLEGKLDVRMGEEVIEADAGTVLYTPSETTHQPRNNYDEPALLLAVNGPGTDSQKVQLDEE